MIKRKERVWRKRTIFSIGILFLVSVVAFVYGAIVISLSAQEDFDTGSYNGTVYSGQGLQIELLEESLFLPNQNESGLINMSGNIIYSTFDNLGSSQEDLSGNGNTGSYYATVNSVKGIINGALQTGLAGAIDYGDIEMNSWDAMTISIWTKRWGANSTGNVERVVAKARYNKKDNFALYYYDDNAGGVVYSGASVYSCYTYAPESLDGKWHHLGAKYSDDEDLWAIYYDGQQLCNVTTTQTTLDDNDNRNLVVGKASPATNTDHFRGYVDDFALWNRALSDLEIQEIYTYAQEYNDGFFYESEVYDLNESVSLEHLIYESNTCYLCSLPNFSKSETNAWFNNTINMSDTIFYFQFNEETLNSHAQGTDFYDSSGLYLHAEEIAGVTLTNESIFGQAVNFSLEGQTIDMGNINFTNLSDGFTVGVWANMDPSDDPTSNSHLIDSHRWGIVDNFALIVRSLLPEFYVYESNSGAYKSVLSTNRISTEQWNHYVGVADPQNSLIILYLNGVEIGNTSFLDSTFSGNSPNVNITFGTDHTYDSRSGFVGLMDEAFMVARAMSSEEIYSIYQRGINNTVTVTLNECNSLNCSAYNSTNFSLTNGEVDISSVLDSQYYSLGLEFHLDEEIIDTSFAVHSLELHDSSQINSIDYSASELWILPEGSRDPSESPGEEAPSIIFLDEPLNGSIGTDRAFEFIWNNSATPDVTYDFQLSTDYNFGSFIISETDLPQENSSQTNYSITNDLDLDTTYYWRVRAVNGITPGDWSEVREVEILSYLAISLPVASGVDFGNLIPGQSEDTETTSGLQPIIIRNDGNYPVNITVNASSFFVNSDGAYQFKIEDNETGSYDFAFTTYTDLNSTAQQAVTNLNYENSTNTGNTVNMHLTITVPSLEPAADKTSLIEISTG